MNPKQVLANEQGGDLGQKWLTDNEAGSGPFKIKRWQQGVLYEIEAVDSYWKGWPSKDHVGGVILKLVRESAAQRAALLRGEADIVEGLTADDYDMVAKTPGIVVPNYPGMTTFGLKMNTQKAPTNDANLRKAIAYAFDYDALLKIYNGNAVLQTSPFPKAMRGHIAVPGFPRQDLAKAKEFLAKSAYASGNVELEYVYVQGLEEERKMGLVLIDNLGKLNLKVKMVPLTWPNMVARGGQGGDVARPAGRVRHAGVDRSRRGRVPVPQELLGQVLRLVLLHQRRRVGADRARAHAGQVGGAGAALRRHPEADRRRHARAVRHAGQPPLGHARSREGLRVQPGALHRRGRPLPAGDRGEVRAILR